MEKLRKDYTIEAEIGIGGFGKVSSARNNKTNEHVAIKTVTPTEFDEDGVPMEVVMLKAAQNVNGVVKLIDYYKLDWETYALVMSKPKNCCDLFDYIPDNKGFPEPDAKKIFGAVVTIVDDLFKIGVVHCDIKDENILIDKDTGDVTLIDFGTARFLEPGKYTDFSGTMQYAPPELKSSGMYEAVPLTVWTLGLLLYALLTGFEAESRHLSLPDKISASAKDLLQKMLQHDPEMRISMTDLVMHDFLA